MGQVMTTVAKAKDTATTASRRSQSRTLIPRNVYHDGGPGPEAVRAPEASFDPHLPTRPHEPLAMSERAGNMEARLWAASPPAALMAEAKHLHTYQPDVLAQHDGVALAELLRRGEVSSRELVDAAIDRAHRATALNAIACADFERAQREATVPREGFFAGVPTFVKDNTAVAGLPTNHGSAAVRSRPAEEPSFYGEQYLSLGFVCLGKSAMPEFGLNATTEPAEGTPTRNPWNTDYSTGASSGGSAALVASGVVPIAHANDGGGSIRIPAACCGLVGLKPTRGRHVVPESARSMPIDLISEGVVTRTLRDTATFHAEAESFYRNPKLPPLGRVEGPGPRRLRIGLLIDSIGDVAADRSTREAVERTARTLERLGHRVEPMDLPLDDAFIEDFRLYWASLAFFLRLGGRRIIDPSFDASRLDDLTRGLARHFSRGFYRLPWALRRLGQARANYCRLFDQVDVFLSPVLAHTTPEIGYLSPNVGYDELMERLTRYVAFTPLANVTGAPALALPAGRTEHGLPVSILLSGNLGDEHTLLELGFELEAEQPWPHVPSAPSVVPDRLG